jgi:hypothetical protein
VGERDDSDVIALSAFALCKQGVDKRENEIFTQSDVCAKILFDGKEQCGN